MLSKCANPACTRAFRYLHEGKLFWRETNRGSGPGMVLKGEWFWLCDHCFHMCHLGADPAHYVIEKGPEQVRRGRQDKDPLPLP
jgi:hypothetical protein